MAQTYWPMPSGSAGAQVLEPQWSLMARNWLATGVISGFLNQLAVSATGTAMQVTVDTGAANIMGNWFKNDALETLNIAAADATNPRIDVIAIRVDWVANTVAFVVLEGTPAASPVAPSLTQVDILTSPSSAKWDVELAQVYVAANATSISTSNITDERSYCGAPAPVPTSAIPNASWINPTLLNNWVNFGSPYAVAAYRKDANGFVHLKGMIKSGTVSGGTTIFSLPAGYQPKESLYPSTTSYDGTNTLASTLIISSVGVQTGANGGNTWLSLDGITFFAEQ